MQITVIVTIVSRLINFALLWFHLAVFVYLKTTLKFEKAYFYGPKLVGNVS